MRTSVFFAWLVLVVVAIFPEAADAQRGRIEPEAATGLSAKGRTVGSKYMAVAANPRATRAGLQILRDGGSATDAAIAMQLVLNLVEPQSSGIGGGAFLVRFDGASGSITTLDGRESAPKAAQADRFLRDGKPMDFRSAVNSGLSVGVPGLVALLWDAHQASGKLPWKVLFQPAIKLAREGFPVSPRLHKLLVWVGPGKFSPPARSYFYSPAGVARPVGYVLRNEDFARTLEQVADAGPAAFYDGPVAGDIVSVVNSARISNGDLTLEDLKSYRVIERAPVCVSYRGNKVCGMGPPSSGGHTVGQTLMLLDGFDLSKRRRVDLRAMHLVAEAEKLAFADRNRYLADPDFVAIPGGLLAPSYVAQRRALINPSEAAKRAAPGLPADVRGQLRGLDQTNEREGTTHISVVDAEGNAVSMTSSIEGAFGSGLWAAGFLLNNELTDFSFRPTDKDGRPIANRVEGGKRPRSSMAPTIVLDEDGKFFAALGSPGGSRIILYVVKSLIALIDWGMDPQAAAALVNFGSRNRGFEIEAGYDAVWNGVRLKRFGHTVSSDSMTSGLHIVVKRDGKLLGGADPRREGAALGD